MNNKFGVNHWNWKGGIRINSQGYRLIYSPEHPHKDHQGYVREHRLVLEKLLGRYLLKEEVVHHKNGNKIDNRASNLEIMGKRDHDSFSSRSRRLRPHISKTCPICKKEFCVPPSLERLVCCSKSCAQKKKWRELGKSVFGR